MATRKPVVWNAGFEAIQSGDSIDQIYITNLTADLAAKAPLASPGFTGAPTAPTAAAATNNTQIATTAYVKSQLANTALTGTPTVPTAAQGTNSTQIASTAYVITEIAARLAAADALDGVTLDGGTY